MQKIIRKEGFKFDDDALVKMYVNKAKTKDECKQLWDNEFGKKWYHLPTDTWYGEVEVNEYS